MSYTRTPAALDDAAFGVATDYVSPAGYLVDEVASDSADEGDIGLARMNPKRIQLAELRTGDGDSAMDETNDAVRVNIVAGAPASPSAVTIADGADVAQGTTTDAAVVSDTSGTVIGFLRGLVKIFASVWDSGAGRLKVDASAVAVPVTDNGGSLTVDGTVAATQGTSPWVIGDGAGSITVDGPLTDTELRATPVPVSGTVTITDGSGPVTVDGTVAATQGTSPWVIGDGGGLISVDDGGGSLTVDGSVTVSGTATVSGTVSVDNITTSVTPGVAATHLGKAEDAGHSSGDTGVMALAVRNDAGTALAGTTGDYIPFSTDSAGNLRVNVSAGASSGTQYTEGDVDASITGTAVMWEDAGDTLEPVSATKPLPVNIVAGSASGVQYTEGDVDASITGTAVMWEDAGDTLEPVSAAKPLPVGDAGGTLTVDDGGTTLSVDDGGGSLTVDGPLTDAQLRATPVPVSGTVTITDGSGPVTVDGTVAATQGTSPWVIGDGGGLISVDDGGGSLTVDGSVTVSGTATVSGTVSVDSITTSVTPGTAAGNLGKAEDAVHASGDTGVMGLTVRKDTAAATAGTDGDYQPAITDATGRTWVNTEMPDAALINDTLDTASALLPTIGTVVLGMTQGATTVSRVKAHDQQLDARSNLINGLAVNAYGYSHNLTSNVGERNRTVNAASGTTGTGVPAQGSMGFDGTNYQPIKVDTGGVVLPGTGATNLGKDEDAAHTSGDTGVAALTIRNDNAGASGLAGSDLDYQVLQSDSSGHLKAKTLDGTADVSITASGNYDIPTNGYSGAYVTVSGVFSGAITFDILQNGVQTNIGAYTLSSATIVGFTTATGTFFMQCAGAESIRLLAAAWVSGTATVRVTMSAHPWIQYVRAAGTLSVLPTGTTNISLGKAEDAAHTTGDTGVPSWTVRNDSTSASGLAGTDLDYQALQSDSSGNLKVTLATVTPGTAATNLGKAEDAPHTSGDTGVMALGVRNDTRGSLAGNDGDYVPPQMNSSGDLRVAPSNPASTITSVDFSTIADASRVLTLLAANVSRRAAVVSNDTDATLYIKEGSSASLTSYSDILPPGCRYLLESTSILTAYVPAIPSGQILVTERV